MPAKNKRGPYTPRSRSASMRHYVKSENARAKRGECTVCGTPKPWYELDMSGRCDECVP